MNEFSKEKVDALVEELNKEFAVFQVDAKKTNNKAAARRARKSSFVIADLLKQYRKSSIKPA